MHDIIAVQSIRLQHTTYFGEVVYCNKSKPFPQVLQAHCICLRITLLHPAFDGRELHISAWLMYHYIPTEFIAFTELLG